MQHSRASSSAAWRTTEERPGFTSWERRTARALGAREVRYDEDVVKISIVGLGMRSHAGVAAKMFQILATEGINIQAISTSEIKISCLVASKYTELAVRALHDGFGLGKG